MCSGTSHQFVFGLSQETTDNANSGGFNLPGIVRQLAQERELSYQRRAAGAIRDEFDDENNEFELFSDDDDDDEESNKDVTPP